MRRKVWLEGDQYYLQPLPDRLHYGDTVIQREGSEYVLMSTDIDAAPDDHAANAIAAKLIRHINAIGRIHDPNFRPMKLGRYTDETGQSVITGVMHTTLPALRSGDAGYPFGAPDYLALAESNSHVGRVLSIFARNDDLTGTTSTRFTKSSGATSSRRSSTNSVGPRRPKIRLSPCPQTGMT